MKFTPRELQVLKLTAAGMSLKECCALLGISSKTGTSYRAIVCRKVNANGVAQMTQYAVAVGIVPALYDGSGVRRPGVVQNVAGEVLQS